MKSWAGEFGVWHCHPSFKAHKPCPWEHFVSGLEAPFNAQLETGSERSGKPFLKGSAVVWDFGP